MLCINNSPRVVPDRPSTTHSLTQILVQDGEYNGEVNDSDGGWDGDGSWKRLREREKFGDRGEVY